MITTIRSLPLYDKFLALSERVQMLCDCPAEFQSILAGIQSRFSQENPGSIGVPLDVMIQKLELQRELLTTRALQEEEIPTQDGFYPFPI